MNEENRPTLFRIIQTDYTSFLCITSVVMLWAFFIFDLIGKGESSANYTVTVATGSFVGLLIFLWRYNSFITIYNQGFEEEGTISGIGFFRGRGKVSYVYLFRGEKYSGSNAILRNGRTKHISVGDRVTVFVNSNNPKKAFIAELYQR
jgi:hypothetical protein